MRGEIEEFPPPEEIQVTKVTECFVPTFTIDTAADWKIN
jgi:hypothetical protein